uniref:Uncharacterized protein n=1 Tax=Oryza glumipatula TaxID=40148 RepID=A0A0E0BHS5_9ORYZ
MAEDGGASGPLAAEEAEEVAAALVDEDSAEDLISLHRFLVPSTCCVMDGAHGACSSSTSMSSLEPESVVVSSGSVPGRGETASTGVD